MTATYTFDVFCSLDGFGSYNGDGSWGGYWGKQTSEFLARRLAQYEETGRFVLGANSYREFVEILGTSADGGDIDDLWITRMRHLPTFVISNTVAEPLEWPDGVVVRGDAVEVVSRLKQEAEIPLRSHGSLSMNRSLMAAGLVDRVQVTIFPVLTGRTGTEPIFAGADDFDLELLEATTLEGGIQELVYRPSLHG